MQKDHFEDFRFCSKDFEFGCRNPCVTCKTINDLNKPINS